MRWEPIARYRIEKGFSISPRIYERFMTRFRRGAKQKRTLLPTTSLPAR